MLGGWVTGGGVTQLSPHKRPQLTHDSHPSRPPTHAILQTHVNPLTSDQPTIEPTSRLNAQLARVLILVEVTSPLEQELSWVVENYVDTNITEEADAYFRVLRMKRQHRRVVVRGFAILSSDVKRSPEGGLKRHGGGSRSSH